MRIQNQAWTVFLRIPATLIVIAYCTATAGYADQEDSKKLKEQKNKEDIEAQKAKLKSDYASVVVGRPGSASVSNGSEPSATAYAAMDSKERKEFVAKVGCLYGRFLQDGLLPDKDLSWAKSALSCLHRRDGDEVLALITNIYSNSVAAAGTLEKLNQAETLARAVYPEIVAGGESEPGGFDRSKLKKVLRRKRLSLMKEGVR